MRTTILVLPNVRPDFQWCLGFGVYLNTLWQATSFLFIILPWNLAEALHLHSKTSSHTLWQSSIIVFDLIRGPIHGVMLIGDNASFASASSCVITLMMVVHHAVRSLDACTSRFEEMIISAVKNHSNEYSGVGANSSDRGYPSRLAIQSIGTYLLPLRRRWISWKSCIIVSISANCNRDQKKQRSRAESVI